MTSNNSLSDSDILSIYELDGTVSSSSVYDTINLSAIAHCFPNTISATSITSDLYHSPIIGDTIVTKQGELPIVDVINHILDTFCIIIPDHAALNSSPQLRDAYTAHQELLNSAISQELKESYKSYKVLVELLKDDQDGQVDI